MFKLHLCVFSLNIYLTMIDCSEENLDRKEIISGENPINWKGFEDQNIWNHANDQLKHVNTLLSKKNSINIKYDQNETNDRNEIVYSKKPKFKHKVDKYLSDHDLSLKRLKYDVNISKPVDKNKIIKSNYNNNIKNHPDVWNPLDNYLKQLESRDFDNSALPQILSLSEIGKLPKNLQVKYNKDMDPILQYNDKAPEKGSIITKKKRYAIKHDNFSPFDENNPQMESSFNLNDKGKSKINFEKNFSYEGSNFHKFSERNWNNNNNTINNNNLVYNDIKSRKAMTEWQQDIKLKKDLPEINDRALSNEPISHTMLLNKNVHSSAAGICHPNAGPSKFNDGDKSAPSRRDKQYTDLLNGKLQEHVVQLILDNVVKNSKTNTEFGLINKNLSELNDVYIQINCSKNCPACTPIHGELKCFLNWLLSVESLRSPRSHYYNVKPERNFLFDQVYLNPWPMYESGESFALPPSLYGFAQQPMYSLGKDNYASELFNEPPDYEDYANNKLIYTSKIVLFPENEE